MTREFMCWLHFADGTEQACVPLALEETPEGWVSRVHGRDPDPDDPPSATWHEALANVQRKWLETGFVLTCIVAVTQSRVEGL